MCVCVCVCVKAWKGPSALLLWDAAFSALLSVVTRTLICTSRNISQVCVPSRSAVGDGCAVGLRGSVVLFVKGDDNFQ